MRPQGWQVFLAVLAAWLLLCVCMWVYHSARGALAELRQAFGEGKARGEADAVRLLHGKDCACDGQCWPAFVARMRDIAARQAAEVDKEHKR